MAATVIDSLVVELGLDPAKFTKGQRDALDAFKKTQGEFDKRLKDLEASGKRAGESFGDITTAAEGLLGALAGAGMAAFARDTMNSAAATGRMAQNMGIATSELDTFGRMIERNGGNAGSAKSSLQGFTDQVARLATFGEGAEKFAQIGITGVTPNMTALEAYMKFVEWAEKNRDNPQRVNILGQALGLDQGAINEALKGIRQVREDWRKARVGALTPEQAAAMQRMQQAWVRLDEAISMVGRDLVVDVAPAFTKIATSVADWTEKNRKLADSIGGILTALTAIAALKPASKLLEKLGFGGAASAAAAAPNLVGKVVKGGGIGGLALSLAEAMKYDSQSGNQLRTMLRHALGIEDSGEAAPWAGALPGKGASGAAARGGSSSLMDTYAAAIAAIESRGSGGYRAIGPVTGSGDRAYGKYQIMGSNIGPWSKAALGRSLTVDEFLASPEFQDAIFKSQFGEYLKKFGNPQDAASAWFTGRPLSSGGSARDVLGTSGYDYVNKFNSLVNNGPHASEGAGAKNDVRIGSITIHTRVTDAAGIASDIGGELKNRLSGPSSLATQANTGLTP